MKKNHLQIGDKVKFKMDDESFLEDLESDLLADVADKCVTGAQYDKIWKAISEQKVLTVCAVEIDGHTKERLYDVSIGKLTLPYSFEAKRFEKIENQ